LLSCERARISAPFYYQWQLNGTNIIGATNATLSLDDILSSETGNYTVVVSNDVNSIISSAGQVTVLPGPAFASIQNPGNGQSVQLNYTGPAGYGYTIWASTNLALTPIQSTWTKLKTGGTFSGATDTYTDSSAGSKTSRFYLITVP